MKELQATGAWADMVNRNDLMTPEEHHAMEMTADLFNYMSKNVFGKNTDARRADMPELAHHIHDLQRMIMSQAACRAFPEKYRLLGEMPSRIPEDDAFECDYVNEQGQKCYNMAGHSGLYPHRFRGTNG